MRASASAASRAPAGSSIRASASAISSCCSAALSRRGAGCRPRRRSTDGTRLCSTAASSTLAPCRTTNPPPRPRQALSPIADGRPRSFRSRGHRQAPVPKRCAGTRRRAARTSCGRTAGSRARCDPRCRPSSAAWWAARTERRFAVKRCEAPASGALRVTAPARHEQRQGLLAVDVNHFAPVQRFLEVHMDGTVPETRDVPPWSRSWSRRGLAPGRCAHPPPRLPHRSVRVGRTSARSWSRPGSRSR